MNLKSSLGVLALCACGTAGADPVSEQRIWQQAYPVTGAAPRLHVRNIWGNVTVRSGNNREIIVSAHELRSAPTPQLLERSKSQLRLDVVTERDAVSLIVDDPNRAEGRADACPGCRLEYQFEITVPAETQIDVATVTEGRVEVDGVHGRVSAMNVNGPVAVHAVHDCANIESVNGALHISFARAPGENCGLKTINGDIQVQLPESAGLDVLLSVAHGSVVSDFAVDSIALPAKVERHHRDDTLSHRLEHPAGLRVGGGGPTFTVATLNGDVRILKHQ